jgi:hypothetical protein
MKATATLPMTFNSMDQHLINLYEKRLLIKGEITRRKSLTAGGRAHGWFPEIEALEVKLKTTEDFISQCESDFLSAVAHKKLRGEIPIETNFLD